MWFNVHIIIILNIVTALAKDLPPTITYHKVKDVTNIEIICELSSEISKLIPSESPLPNGVPLNEKDFKSKKSRFDRSLSEEELLTTVEPEEETSPAEDEIFSKVKDSGTKKFNKNSYKKIFVKSEKDNYNSQLTTEDSNINIQEETHNNSIPESSISTLLLNTAATLEEGSVNGSKRVHVNSTFCGRTIFDKNSIDSHVRNLHIVTESEVVLAEQWAEQSTHLENLVIINPKDIKGITTCGWWPLHLQTLDFTHIPLQYLNFSGCLSPPSSLSELKLSNNQLISAQICAPKLELLDVSRNFLTNSSSLAECDGGLSEIQKLDISHNHLENWTFCGWDRLTVLDISYNSIKNLIFKGCPTNIVHLEMTHNEIEEIHGHLPEALSVINLSHNRLSSIPLISETLKTGRFSHNNISKVTHKSVKSALSLTFLDLSHNKIDVIQNNDLKGLRELIELDLSHNNLHHIGVEALIPLFALQELKLQKNKLVKLNAKFLLHVPKSLKVHLEQNPWKCHCQNVDLVYQVVKLHCEDLCPPSVTKNLKCVESGQYYKMSDASEYCHKSMTENRKKDKHDDDDSDEEDDDDLSEEDLTTSERIQNQNKQKTYTFAIPGVIVLLLFLVGGVFIHSMYKKRKSFGRSCHFMESYCDCLAPSRHAPVTLDEHIDDHESDTDTEMTHITSHTATTDF